MSGTHHLQQPYKALFSDQSTGATVKPTPAIAYNKQRTDCSASDLAESCVQSVSFTAALEFNTERRIKCNLKNPLV